MVRRQNLEEVDEKSNTLLFHFFEEVDIHFFGKIRHFFEEVDVLDIHFFEGVEGGC